MGVSANKRQRKEPEAADRAVSEVGLVLCRNYFGTRSPVVFGWVFASHQLGAAIAAAGAGRLRDLQGNYDMAFYLAAGLCFVAAALCLNVRKAQVSVPVT